MTAVVAGEEGTANDGGGTNSGKDATRIISVAYTLMDPRSSDGQPTSKVAPTLRVLIVAQRIGQRCSLCPYRRDGLCLLRNIISIAIGPSSQRPRAHTDARSRHSETHRRSQHFPPCSSGAVVSSEDAYTTCTPEDRTASSSSRTTRRQGPPTARVSVRTLQDASTMPVASIRINLGTVCLRRGMRTISAARIVLGPMASNVPFRAVRTPP